MKKPLTKNFFGKGAAISPALPAPRAENAPEIAFCPMQIRQNFLTLILYYMTNDETIWVSSGKMTDKALLEFQQCIAEQKIAPAGLLRLFGNIHFRPADTMAYVDGASYDKKKDVLTMVVNIYGQPFDMVIDKPRTFIITTSTFTIKQASRITYEERIYDKPSQPAVSFEN